MSSPLPRRNPLPQLVPARLRRVQKRVEELVWSRRRALNVACSSEQLSPLETRQAAQLEVRSLRPGEYLGRPGDNWSQFWMRVDVPPAAADELGSRFLHWKCQGETTVWHAGKPWAGLDLGHRECPLPDDVLELWLECCSWQTGIWISMLDNDQIGSHGLRFDGAEMANRNPIAWNCCCDLDAIVQMMDQALRAEPDLKLSPRIGYCRALENASPRLRKLLFELDDLCDVWDQTQSLDRLGVWCREFFARWPAESWQPIAAVAGHAHIDLVWLWPESATRKKIVHTFATVLRLMERYPEMVFTQSTPALYRMLEEDAPDVMAQVARHIASRRWEVVGAFEVEPDVNLPGGEALVRSIVIGQRKIERLTGSKSAVAWIPDVFGYSQCLPQIMALGGVKYFYTTKMIWSQITKFPYTSFVWRGADGSEILSHLGTTDYNGEMRLDAHDLAMAQHRQAGVHPELLLPTGYGDGGGGPTEVHIERARRFENLSGAARTQWTRVDAFFARLAERMDQLPVYQGELYLEFHRGTYTTQSEFKRLYRRAEQALQMHEAILAALGRSPLPEEAWLRVLFAHFHDAIPGSSIGRVYAEMNAELQAVGDREVAAARRTIAPNEQQAGDSSALVAFNSLPYERLAVIEHDQEALQLSLPALASARPLSPHEIVDPIREASHLSLCHDRLAARFDAQGRLASLVVDCQELELAQSACFVLSPDDPSLFDAWDIDHAAARLGEPAALAMTLSVIEHSPARAILESQTVAIGDSSQLRVRYILEAGSLHLKVEANVAWRESHRLLRYVAPTRYLGRRALFGCPFGAIERPQLSGVESDEAMWEVPASRWGAVQHDGGADGLVLTAESKLGFAARDGVLALSLLRAPKWPDADADMGEHAISFAIGRLHLETTAAHLSSSMSADALYSRPLLYEGEPISTLFHWRCLGTLNPSWCAPSEASSGAYFIRLHETAGRPGIASLHLARGASRADLVDFHEGVLASLSIAGDQSLSIPYRPWQILTLRIIP